MSERPRVLVIDDEPGMRDMLSYELSMEGFDVETAVNGLEAVEAVKRRRFDLAVTDLKMPGMDGVATVAALRSLDPDLEVIVATGYATIETAVAAMRNGAYDYIQKPYDLGELRLLLDRAMQKNQLQGIVALYEASRGLLATLDHDDLMRLVVTLAQRVLRADEIGVVLTGTAGGREIHRLAPDRGPSQELLIAMADVAIMSGGPRRLPMRGETAFTDALADEGFGSALVYPLRCGDETVGALAVLRRGGSPEFSQGELQKGAIFASQLALSLANARLYGRLEDKIAELIATREQLVQTEKLAAMGHLAEGMAHEINNPLAVVTANLGSLRDYSSRVGSLWLAAKGAAVYLRGRGEPQAAEHAEKLVPEGDLERTNATVREIAEVIDDTLEGVRRIADLVEGFTRLSMPGERGEVEIVQLPDLVDECLRKLEVIAPAPGPILVERERCRGALVAREDIRAAFLDVMAFLRRPREARASGAPTTIRVHEVDGRPNLLIVDGGLKMTEEERRRVFDPRMVPDAARGRTIRFDLGLTFTCRVIERNGGAITASDTDGGTAIRIVLPGAREVA